MFRIAFGKGFHITFPNGITLSTQIGWSNYCDNYNYKIPEIAIWNKNKKWITKKIVDGIENEEGCNVNVKIGIDEWLEIFEKCKNYKEA